MAKTIEDTISEFSENTSKELKKTVLFIFGLVFLVLSGTFYLIDYIQNRDSSINLAKKTPMELNERLNELGIKECRGTFVSDNPFEKNFISVFIYDKAKDKNGVEFVKFKYDPSHRDFSSDETQNFAHWKYTDCKEVISLDAKYSTF